MLVNKNFFYLKTFVTEQKNIPGNRFVPVYSKKITENEKRLGFNFPSELKDFYNQIGYGFLITKHNETERCEYSNRILDPESIADILIDGTDNEELHPEAEFEEGEMPFFEVGEMRDFLTMRPLSKNPNAVYHIDGELIDESFSNFIWRLYYESPTFYLDY